MSNLTNDECIELAMELERAMVRRVLDETKKVNNYAERLDPLAVGWSAALEEFEFRVNEKWKENPSTNLISGKLVSLDELHDFCGQLRQKASRQYKVSLTHFSAYDHALSDVQKAAVDGQLSLKVEEEHEE